MKGRLIALDGQKLTVELDGDFRETFDELRDADVDVSVKKFRRKRSLDSNGYAWVLVNKLAAKLNVTPKEVYREVVRNIGGASEIVCVRTDAVDKLREQWESHGIGWQTDTMPSKLDGCLNVILYYGSSTYDSKQMSALIDVLVDECKSLNIETMTPDEIASMEASWAGR